MILASIIPGWKYVSAGVGILVLGFVAWFLLDAYVLSPSDLLEEQETALNAVVEDYQAQLLTRLGEIDRRNYHLAIAPIASDTSNGQYRHAFQSKLNDDAKRIVVKTKNFGDSVLGDLKGVVSDNSEPSEAEAIFGANEELNAILVINTITPGDTATEVNLKIDATLYERMNGSEGKVEMRELTSYKRVSFDTQEVMEEDAPENTGGIWAIVGMTFVAVLCSLGIPFLWLPATDSVTGGGNNIVGIVYLVVVVASAMTPYFLFGLPLPFGILLILVTAAWTYKMHDAWSERLKI